MKFRLSGEIRNVHMAAWVLASFALLSQVLGLVRDRLFAGAFGVSLELDMYNAAFRLPDLLFVILMPLISASVIIPLLHHESDKEKRRVVLDGFWSIFASCLVVGGLVIFFAAPYLLSWVFPGYEGASLETLTTLTRILLLQPLFLGLSTLLGVVAQFEERFVLPALSPVLYNLGIVLGLLLFLPQGGLVGVVWGVVFGAILHAVPVFFYAVNHKWLPRLHLGHVIKQAGHHLASSWARSAAMLGAQVNQLLVTRASSILSVGALSAFSLGLNVQSLPLSVLISSYAQAGFSQLSRAASAGETGAFKKLARQLLLVSVIWIIPAIIGLYMLRIPITRVIYGLNEQFTFGDMYATSAAAGVLAFALLFQAIFMISIRFFYAKRQFFIPLLGVGLGVLSILLFSSVDALRTWLESLSLIIGFNLAPFASENFHGITLSLMYAIGAFVAVLPVIFGMRTMVSKISLKWVFHILVCALAMIASMVVAMNFITPNIESWWATVIDLLIVGGVGSLVYIALMWRPTLKLIEGAQ